MKTVKTALVGVFGAKIQFVQNHQWKAGFVSWFWQCYFLREDRALYLQLIPFPIRSKSISLEQSAAKDLKLLL